MVVIASLLINCKSVPILLRDNHVLHSRNGLEFSKKGLGKNIAPSASETAKWPSRLKIFLIAGGFVGVNTRSDPFGGCIYFLCPRFLLGMDAPIKKIAHRNVTGFFF